VPVREGVAAFGEIGLTGRLRQASQVDRRFEECAKLGIATVVAPPGGSSRTTPRSTGVETLRDALRAALEKNGRADAA
jgi:DNA repair protein RadA/Sms